MAFTQTNLATVPLLETTFISDMRLIVNANTALLRTQLEDIINGLQFDIVNKYIGVDTPVNKVFSQDIVVSNSILFKAGSASSAATIASLTQNSGISSFLVDNITFTTDLKSVASGSGVSVPTVVIGTNGALPVNPFGVNGGTGQPNPKQQGLYVGDAVTPIPSNFYGEANFKKQAICESSVLRQVQLIDGTGYTYADLVLSKTDPKFIYVFFILPSGYTQTTSKPVYLFLHEDYTSADTRPAVGQTFVIVPDVMVQSDLTTVVANTDWPPASILNSAAGVNIISGFKRDSTTGSGKVKSGYINLFTGSVPGDAAAAVTARNSNEYVRFFNPYTGPSTPKTRGASISLTKTDQASANADYSTYTVTSFANAALIN